MKKLISIILVLVLAFAFSITVLAEEGLDVYYPPDPGEDNENFDLDLEEPPEGIDGEIWGVDAETFDDDDWDDYINLVDETIEAYFESDAYDEEIYFDGVQYLVSTLVGERDGEDIIATGAVVGGWITISNYDLGNNKLNAILQAMQLEENGDWAYILLNNENFYYDAETGTLYIYVDDLGWFSIFWALIERGVDPETAAKVASARSPRTADNSIHVGIVLLLVLSAVTTTVVISKKARTRV